MTWQNTPYHHLANVKGAGVDCAQLLIEVYHKIGVLERIDVGFYPKDWHLHRSEEVYLMWVEKYCKPDSEPRPGNIVMFKFGRCISHAGIITRWPRLIHSYVKHGVVIATVNDAELKGRLYGFYNPFKD